MGKHYVPQHLLNGFTEDDRIWAYDRLKEKSFRTITKSIAHECDMYSDEVEQRLANVIEEPVKDVVSRLREGRAPTDSERQALARYIAALWKRVPKGRDRACQSMPRVGSELRVELHQKLDLIAAAVPHSTALVATRRNQVDELIDAFTGERSREIWQQTIDTVNERLIEAMLSMKWMYMRSPSSSPQLLLSDNPVYIHTALGIGNAESELSLPLSSRLVLHAARGPFASNTFARAIPAFVREMNRRQAHNATRFVFAARNEEWIGPFVAKCRYHLNRIRP